MEQNTLEITIITDKTEGNLSFEQLKRSELLSRVFNLITLLNPAIIFLMNRIKQALARHYFCLTLRQPIGKG